MFLNPIKCLICKGVKTYALGLSTSSLVSLSKCNKKLLKVSYPNLSSEYQGKSWRHRSVSQSLPTPQPEGRDDPEMIKTFSYITVQKNMLGDNYFVFGFQNGHPTKVNKCTPNGQLLVFQAWKLTFFWGCHIIIRKSLEVCEAQNLLLRVCLGIHGDVIKHEQLKERKCYCHFWATALVLSWFLHQKYPFAHICV